MPENNFENHSDRKVMAIIALVLGILSIVLFFIPIVDLLLGITGIVLGALSLKSSRHGLAIGGLVCGIVGFVISGIFTICACGFYGAMWPEIKEEINKNTCEASGGTYYSTTKCCIHSDGTRTCADD